MLYRLPMKAMLAVTALTILVLVGATRLPPADLSGAIDDFCAPLNPNRRASNERARLGSEVSLRSAGAEDAADLVADPAATLEKRRPRGPTSPSPPVMSFIRRKNGAGAVIYST